MDRTITVIAQLSWLLPLVLLFSLLVLMLATLQHFLAEIRLGRHAIPLDPSALHSPGEATRRRIDRINGEITAFAVATGTIPLALYAAMLSYVHFLHMELGWMDSAYVGVISAGFIMYASRKIKRLKAKRRRLQAAYEGRMAVVQEVNRLMPDGYRVYHAFPTDRFHIDHIIVGPNGVFTLTTKVLPRSGNSDRDRLTVDGRHLFLDKQRDERTLTHAAFQASWLAKWLLTSTGEALTVQPLLTIPGREVVFLRPSDVMVVAPAAIGDAIHRYQGPRLSDKTIRLVSAQVEVKCRSAQW